MTTISTITITTFLNNILDGNLDAVRSQENINELINAIGKINPRGYDLIPLFAAFGLYEDDEDDEDDEELRKEMFEYLLSIPTIDVSKVVVHHDGGDWTDTIMSTFHMMSSTDVSVEICNMILQHPSMDVEKLNTIDHDKYTPLDLAVEYNPKIVPLLISKGAIYNTSVSGKNPQG